MGTLRRDEVFECYDEAIARLESMDPEVLVHLSDGSPESDSATHPARFWLEEVKDRRERLGQGGEIEDDYGILAFLSKAEEAERLREVISEAPEAEYRFIGCEESFPGTEWLDELDEELFEGIDESYRGLEKVEE
jgi:hypothetical protein